MIKYQDVLAKATSEAKLHIQQFVTDGFIKEWQVGAILEKAFYATSKQNAREFNINITKLIFILFRIKGYGIRESDSKAFENTFKRLMSSNGHETFNEICAHELLSSLFIDYRIYPLYGKGADGVVLYETGNVNVEIKSRFPKRYKDIRDFCNEFRHIYQNMPENLDIFWFIYLDKIDNASASLGKAEVALFQAQNQVTDYVNLRRFPDIHSIGRQVPGIHYRVDLFVKDIPAGVKSWHMPETVMQEAIKRDAFFFTIQFPRFYNNTITGQRSVEVILSAEIKKELADLLVVQCIKSAKNIPDEPRIILIYSHHGHESGEVKFVEQVVDAYIERHSKTMIIIANAVFDDPAKAGFSITHIKYGTDLQDFVNSKMIVPHNTSVPKEAPSFTVSEEGLVSHSNNMIMTRKKTSPEESDEIT